MGVVTDAQQIESCVRSCFPKLQSLTTGYMLLYDDQGVSLVYGSLLYVRGRGEEGREGQRLRFWHKIAGWFKLIAQTEYRCRL